jgi:hypothetical protein
MVLCELEPLDNDELLTEPIKLLHTLSGGHAVPLNPDRDFGTRKQAIFPVPLAHRSF